MLLNRYAYLERVTLGVIQLPGARIFTVERPWLPDPDTANPAGLPERSCVPEGTYLLEPHHSPRFPNVYALQNPSLAVWHYAVPPGAHGRAGILIHAGNDVSAVVGCIAVGLSAEASAYAPGGYRITDSQRALQMVRDYLGAPTSPLASLEIAHGHYPMPAPQGRVTTVAKVSTISQDGTMTQPASTTLGAGPLEPERQA